MQYIHAYVGVCIYIYIYPSVYRQYIYIYKYTNILYIYGVDIKQRQKN